MKKKKIGLKYSSFENIVILGFVLAFFIILTPLAYTSLPSDDAGPKYDAVTGMVADSVVDSNMTFVILVFLAIAFLIPVELMLRKSAKKSKRS